MIDGDGDAMFAIAFQNMRGKPGGIHTFSINTNTPHAGSQRA
jgi:hypothetical protein